MIGPQGAAEAGGPDVPPGTGGGSGLCASCGARLVAGIDWCPRCYTRVAGAGAGRDRPAGPGAGAEPSPQPDLSGLSSGTRWWQVDPGTLPVATKALVAAFFLAAMVGGGWLAARTGSRMGLATAAEALFVAAWVGVVGGIGAFAARQMWWRSRGAG